MWDGVQVAGETVQVGASCEPVLLHVTYPAPSSSSCGGRGSSRSSAADGEDCEYELVSGFPKNSTLKELRVRRYHRRILAGSPHMHIHVLSPSMKATIKINFYTNRKGWFKAVASHIMHLQI